MTDKIGINIGIDLFNSKLHTSLGNHTLESGTRMSNAGAAHGAVEWRIVMVGEEHFLWGVREVQPILHIVQVGFSDQQRLGAQMLPIRNEVGLCSRMDDAKAAIEGVLSGWTP